MPKATLNARNMPIGYQTILSNGTHGYLADEPVADNGTDLGFAPYDLLLSALAACKTMTIRYLARQKGWPLDDVHAELSLDTERRDGQTVTDIQVKIRLEGDLTDDQRTQLMRAADRCPVHRMLKGELNIAEAVSY
jgi:putative redox protein